MCSCAGNPLLPICHRGIDPGLRSVSVVYNITQWTSGIKGANIKEFLMKLADFPRSHSNDFIFIPSVYEEPLIERVNFAEQLALLTSSITVQR